jgi:hypothetical protein
MEDILDAIVLRSILEHGSLNWLDDPQTCIQCNVHHVTNVSACSATSPTELFPSVGCISRYVAAQNLIFSLTCITICRCSMLVVCAMLIAQVPSHSADDVSASHSIVTEVVPDEMSRYILAYSCLWHKAYKAEELSLFG